MSFQKLDISMEDPKDEGSGIVFVGRERGTPEKERGERRLSSLLLMDTSPYCDIVLSLVFPEMVWVAPVLST